MLDLNAADYWQSLIPWLAVRNTELVMSLALIYDLAWNVLARLDEAMNWLWRVENADGIELGEDEKRGVFRLAQYGQIHSLSDRLNEVMLKVSF